MSKENETNMVVDLEPILERIGSFGKWQKITFLLLSLTSAASGLAVVTFSFTGYLPAYRCSIPYCSNDDSYNPSFISNLSSIIPERSLKTNSFCTYYVPQNLSSTASCEEYVIGILQRPLDLDEVLCSYDSVIFSESHVLSSVTMAFRLICNHSYGEQLVGSSYMLGMLVGSFLLGLLSDFVGRRKALMTSILLLSFCGSLSSGMPEVFSYTVLRFLTAMGGTGCFIISFVLVAEIVGSKYTMIIGIAIEIPFALGELLLGIEAYFIRNWIHLQLASHVPLCLLLLLWFFVTESPRWCLAKNKIEEAKNILVSAAKTNGVQGELNMNELFLSSSSLSEEKRGKETLADLFITPTIRYRSLNMFFQWFSVTMVYYGLSFASTSLSGNPYVNFNSSVVIEIPAYIFCFFVMDRWGRRPLLSLCQIIAGVSCIVIGLLDPSIESYIPLQIFLSLLGKFGASASFAIVYVYTAELFPTVIRNTAIGMASTIARLGGICAILIGLISVTWSSGPHIIMGVCACLAGLLSVFFPETAGTPLPSTIEEAITIGKDSKIQSCKWRIFCCKKEVS